MNVEKRQEIERKVVRHLIRTMKEKGWIVTRINNCGEPDEDTINPNGTEAMEAVFSVDESKIYFTKGSRFHVVIIVLGNDGWDCIADYGYSDTGDDDFEEIMTEEVDPYCAKLELEV